MDDLNNYVVIGVKHYDALLNELFTVRQNNAFLNRENTELSRQIEQLTVLQQPEVDSEERTCVSDEDTAD